MRKLKICSLQEIKILPSYRHAFKCNNCSQDSELRTDKSYKTRIQGLKKFIESTTSYLKRNYPTVLFLSAVTIYILIIIAPTFKFPSLLPLSSSKISYEEYLNPITPNESENFHEQILISEKFKENTIKPNEVENLHEPILNSIKFKENPIEPNKVENFDEPIENKFSEPKHCELFKKISNIKDKLEYAAKNFGLSLKLEKLSEFFEAGYCKFFVGIIEKKLIKISLDNKQRFVDIDEVYQWLVSPDNRYFIYTTPKASLHVVNLLTLSSERLHRTYLSIFTNSFISVSSDSRLLYFSQGSYSPINVYSLWTLEEKGKFDRIYQRIVKFNAISTNLLAVRTEKNLKVFRLPETSPIFEITTSEEVGLLDDHHQKFRDLLS